ncbi:ribonuclease H-like domain-containing protein [Tanacetum coccineum]
MAHQQPALIPSYTHPMVTHTKDGISKHVDYLSLYTTTTSPISRSHIHALRDLFFGKKLYGSISRYKARLMANGPSQQLSINCDETFSLVVKPATIRMVLSLEIFRNWHIHQLDVKNAFLLGHLSETIYMHQPPGFVDLYHPDYVCHLQRSLSRLKQAPCALLMLHELVFNTVKLTCHCSYFIRVISSLHGEFAMTDLCSRNYNIGVSAQCSNALSQATYAEELLDRAHM